MKKPVFSITKNDFKIDWFSGTGAGGQHRNRHQCCCRLTHMGSGITVTGQSHKERITNQKEALNNLVNHPKFKLWYTRRFNEIINEKTIDELVDESIDEKNLKIEIRKDRKWKQGDI